MNFRISIIQHEVVADRREKFPLRKPMATMKMSSPARFIKSACLPAIYPRGKIEHDHRGSLGIKRKEMYH